MNSVPINYVARQSKRPNQNRLMFLSALLFLPFYIFALPGFEVTPSLLLAPLILLFIRARSDMNIVFIVAFCFIVGAISAIYTSEFRRVASAYTAAYPFLFLIFGKKIARESNMNLDMLSKLIIPIFILSAIAILPEGFQRGLSIRAWDAPSLAHMAIGQYSEGNFSFINLTAPFYGKFGVLTFASVMFAIVMLSAPAIISLRSLLLRVVLGICWVSLAIIISSLYSLQITLGIMTAIIVFSILTGGVIFRVLMLFGLAALILSLLIFYSNFLGYLEYISPFLYENYTQLKNFEIDRLTSGRVDILVMFFSNFELTHFLFGCGFCDFQSVFGLEFSSAHFSFITSLGKAGMFFLLAQLYFIWRALMALTSLKSSLTRNVYIAFLISILIQSVSWDLFQLQVLSPIVFCLCGFAIQFKRDPRLCNSSGFSNK